MLNAGSRERGSRWHITMRFPKVHDSRWGVAETRVDCIMGQL